MSEPVTAGHSPAMLNWRDIPYLHWQPKVSFGTPALGEALFGHLDVDQAIRSIILTEKDTVPLEPEKCVRLRPWIDAPEREAVPNITRELWDAITLFEPRVTLQSIKPSYMSDGRWLFKLALRLTGDVEKKIITMEVPYGPT